MLWPGSLVGSRPDSSIRRRAIELVSYIFVSSEMKDGNAMSSTFQVLYIWS